MSPQTQGEHSSHRGPSCHSKFARSNGLGVSRKRWDLIGGCATSSNWPWKKLCPSPCQTKCPCGAEQPPQPDVYPAARASTPPPLPASHLANPRVHAGQVGGLHHMHLQQALRLLWGGDASPHVAGRVSSCKQAPPTEHVRDSREQAQFHPAPKFPPAPALVPTLFPTAPGPCSRLVPTSPGPRDPPTCRAAWPAAPNSGTSMPSGNRNGSRAVVEMKELRVEGRSEGRSGIGWNEGTGIFTQSGDL